MDFEYNKLGTFCVSFSWMNFILSPSVIPGAISVIAALFGLYCYYRKNRIDEAKEKRELIIFEYQLREYKQKVDSLQQKVEITEPIKEIDHVQVKDIEKPQ